MDLYDAYWNTLLISSKLKKGAIKTLKELRKSGFRIGLITDLTAHIQLRKLNALGLSDYIDVFVSSEEFGREKPHPSPFLLGLNKLDSKPDEAIMVGDSIKKDIEGANALKITSIHLSNTKKYDKIKPDFTIKTLPEILEIIKKL